MRLCSPRRSRDCCWVRVSSNSSMLAPQMLTCSWGGGKLYITTYNTHIYPRTHARSPDDHENTTAPCSNADMRYKSSWKVGKAYRCGKAYMCGIAVVGYTAVWEHCQWVWECQIRCGSAGILHQLRSNWGTVKTIPHNVYRVHTDQVVVGYLQVRWMIFYSVSTAIIQHCTAMMQCTVTMCHPQFPITDQTCFICHIFDWQIL